MSGQDCNYREALQDDESLALFLRNMREFQQAFIDMVVSRRDFTLKLEVRGDLGKLLHCRVSKDHFDKPRADAGSRNGRKQPAKKDDS